MNNNEPPKLQSSIFGLFPIPHCHSTMIIMMRQTKCFSDFFASHFSPVFFFSIAKNVHNFLCRQRSVPLKTLILLLVHSPRTQETKFPSASLDVLCRGCANINQKLSRRVQFKGAMIYKFNHNFSALPLKFNSTIIRLHLGLGGFWYILFINTISPVPSLRIAQ